MLDQIVVLIILSKSQTMLFPILNDFHEDGSRAPLSSDHLFMDSKAMFDFTSDVFLL